MVSVVENLISKTFFKSADDLKIFQAMLCLVIKQPLGLGLADYSVHSANFTPPIISCAWWQHQESNWLKWEKFKYIAEIFGMVRIVVFVVVNDDDDADDDDSDDIDDDEDD